LDCARKARRRPWTSIGACWSNVYRVASLLGNCMPSQRLIAALSQLLRSGAPIVCSATFWGAAHPNSSAAMAALVKTRNTLLVAESRMKRKGANVAIFAEAAPKAPHSLRCAIVAHRDDRPVASAGVRSGSGLPSSSGAWQVRSFGAGWRFGLPGRSPRSAHH